MEKNEIDILAIIKEVWLNRRKLIKWGIIGLIVGVIIAFSIPKQYETLIKIVPESHSGQLRNSGSMGALAGIMGVDIGTVSMEGITEDIYPEILASTPFLMEFTEMQVPYDGHQISLFDYIIYDQKKTWWNHILHTPGQLISWVTSWGSRSDTLNVYNSEVLRQHYTSVLSNKIMMDKDKKSGIITLICTMQSPEIGKIFMDSLILKLQRYVINYRTNKTRLNLENNTKMMEEARAAYYLVDQQYADLADRNQNLISQSAKIRIDRLKNERELAFSIYQQLALQVETDKVKLQEETPIMTVVEPTRTGVHPVAPKKTMIIVLCVMVGALAATLSVVFKNLE